MNMIYKIVSVHDRATDAYGRPIFVVASGQAIRSFQDEINRVAPENEMNRHPDDYDLYELGTFDDSNGQLTSYKEPHQLAIGKQMLATRN